jgi:hypothetical protein
MPAQHRELHSAAHPKIVHDQAGIVFTSPWNQRSRNAGNREFDHPEYAVNIIAALIPSMSVKRRANGPLLHSTWWQMDHHSAVLVVSLAAILSSALVFLATRTGFRQWRIFVGCGIVAGDFPATFYLATAPDNVYLPLSEMYVDGTVCGLVAGAVLTLLLQKSKTKRCCLAIFTEFPILTGNSVEHVRVPHSRR